MQKRLVIISILVLLIAACEQTPVAQNLPPTPIPFPTMTPGRYVRGRLETPMGLQLSGGSGGLANPATAVAMANQPTATPDYSACPQLGNPTLGDAPGDARSMLAEIERFLSAGGTVLTLETRLRNDWAALGETGTVRGDLDLTGEGAAEVLLTFDTPNNGGALVILGCSNQRYTVHYQNITGGAVPRIIQIADMTFGGDPEILFTGQRCADDGVCQYVTQLISWRGDLGRFVSLLGRDIISDSEPSIGDVDEDDIVEVVVQLDNAGTAETGPLRTGVNIYDWNGAAYVKSIVQLDPPSYRIQIVHQADRAMSRLNAEEAIALYTFTLQDVGLRDWYRGESDQLRAYTMFRLLIARAYVADEDILTTYQDILDAYPDPDTAPIYVRLSTVFWNALNITNNLRSACLEVRDMIGVEPQALELLNRYGERSPTYTAESVCPL
jgi:hypothetical protein